MILDFKISNSIFRSGRDGGYCHTAAVLNKYTDFIYNWLAPEIISGEAPVEQSDVYSLCAVIWEVLNGERREGFVWTSL